MHLRRTSEFDDEACRFRLRHACEDCGHFDAAGERCRHGWPSEAHRRARYLTPPREGDELVFCKEFELR